MMVLRPQIPDEGWLRASFNGRGAHGLSVEPERSKSDLCWLCFFMETHESPWFDLVEVVA
jgi:hypothetical protein